MFDFNEGGHGFPGYADNLRAAIGLARQKMNRVGPLDVVFTCTRAGADLGGREG